MINVSRENELASKLDTLRNTINDIASEYSRARTEIEKNDTNSSKKYSSTISDNIGTLIECNNKLRTISSTIRQKAQEIRNRQEEEAKKRETT